MGIEKQITLPPRTVATGIRRFFLCGPRSVNKASSSSAGKPISILKRRHHMKYTKPYPLKPRDNNSETAARKITTTRYPKDQQGGTVKFVLHDDFAPPGYHHHETKKKKQQQQQQQQFDSTRTALITPTSTVRFYKKVQVLRIPSKDQYPEEMKRKLWGSVAEISENARRNTVEYSADGWDWKTATEEKDMYYHPKSGEYIHPVHVQRLRLCEEQRRKQRQQEQSYSTPQTTGTVAVAAVVEEEEEEEEQQESSSSISSSSESQQQLAIASAA